MMKTIIVLQPLLVEKKFQQFNETVIKVDGKLRITERNFIFTINDIAMTVPSYKCLLTVTETGSSWSSFLNSRQHTGQTHQRG